MQLGKVTVKLLAQCGEMEPVEIGFVTVPLVVEPHGPTRFQIDLAEPLDAVKAMVRTVFEQSAEDDQ